MQREKKSSFTPNRDPSKKSGYPHQEALNGQFHYHKRSWSQARPHATHHFEACPGILELSTRTKTLEQLFWCFLWNSKTRLAWALAANPAIWVTENEESDERTEKCLGNCTLRAHEYIISMNPPNSSEVLILLFQMRKRKLRQFKELARGQTAAMNSSWFQNQVYWLQSPWPYSVDWDCFLISGKEKKTLLIRGAFVEEQLLDSY